MKKFFLCSLLFLLCNACDTKKLQEIPFSQFEGTWILKNRGMLEEIVIEISKDQDGNYTGQIKKLNENKYVQMFLSDGDVLLSGISRQSNFEFSIDEKKIAAPLFSSYGISSTSTFKATFAHRNKILLGNKGSDGYYLRVN